MFTRINNLLSISNEIFDISPNGGIARYFRNIEMRFKHHEIKSNKNRQLLHLTYYSVFIATIGFLRGSVLITTIHDAIYEEKLERNYKVVLRKFICCILSSHIIYVSRTTRDKYLKHFPVLSRKKSSVVYHFSTFENKVSNKSTEYTKKPYILYVGNRSGYKNGHELLELAKANEEYVFVFVGGERTNDQHGDNVKFLRNINDTSLTNLYQGAFAFVTTSKDEGFNIPIIEAQSLGCPVICTDIDIHREVAETSAMYIPCKEFASAVLEHLESLKAPEVRERFRKLGTNNVKRFSSTSFYNAHRDIYES